MSGSPFYATRNLRAQRVMMGYRLRRLTQSWSVPSDLRRVGQDRHGGLWWRYRALYPRRRGVSVMDSLMRLVLLKASLRTRALAVQRRRVRS